MKIMKYLDIMNMIHHNVKSTANLLFIFMLLAPKLVNNQVISNDTSAENNDPLFEKQLLLSDTNSSGLSQQRSNGRLLQLSIEPGGIYFCLLFDMQF